MILGGKAFKAEVPVLLPFAFSGIKNYFAMLRLSAKNKLYQKTLPD